MASTINLSKSRRAENRLKDCSGICITNGTCSNLGEKTLQDKVQLQLKTVSDEGAKLRYMKGVFYLVIFIYTQKVQITSSNLHCNEQL